MSPMKQFYQLLTIFCILSAIATAQEELHCIVMDVPLNNLPLVREEMALASPPVAGKDPRLFSTNGRPRDVLFRSNVSLTGKQQVELGTGGKGKTPAQQGSNPTLVTIAVEIIPGRTATLHRHAISLLLPSGSAEALRFETRGQILPVIANRWQEVASWTSGVRSVMIWQYVTSKSSGDAAPGRSLNKERLPDAERHYTVDIFFSVVPQATARQFDTFSPELASAAVDWLYRQETGQWKYFRINARSEIPFMSRSARVDMSGIQKPGHEDTCLVTLNGTMTVSGPDIVTLDGQLGIRGDLARQGQIKACSFDGDVPLGQWKLQALADGPVIQWNLPTLPGWTPERPHGTAKVNLVLFRVRKVDH